MNLLFWYRSLMRSVGATLVKLIATATSGLVSFTTNVIRPVKVICEFSPVQEGTGNPSPDNVRPISGWTGCEIRHTGKNLVPDFNVTYEFWSRGWLNSSGGISSSSTPYITSSFVEIKPENSYIFSSNSGGWKAHAFFDKDKIFISGTYKETNRGTAPENAKYIRISLSPNKSSTIYLPTTVQLESGDTVTGRENYVEPVSLPITFTDPSTGDPMTVYGGTVTLNEDGSAELVTRYYYKKIQNLRWGRLGNNFIRAYSYLSDASVIGNYTYDLLCNRLKPFFKRDSNANVEYSIRTDNSFGRTCVYVELTQTAEEEGITTEALALNYVNDWLTNNPTYVCFRTTNGSPKTYHFDNIGQLQSFIGTNNIWHNMNGSITAEYYNKQ